MWNSQELFEELKQSLNLDNMIVYLDSKHKNYREQLLKNIFMDIFSLKMNFDNVKKELIESLKLI